MKKATILLIDDSRTVQMMGKMVLKRTAFNLIIANDGEEGVQKAIQEKPDVILMDIIMPKMSGLEATRKLRELEETKNIPIIMLTTRGEEENIEEAFRSGCNEFVTKPFNSIDLIEKIKSFTTS